MGKKVSIIGAGNVGATIAYTLTVSGMAAEIALVDINKDKARGEALDIFQGTAFCAPKIASRGKRMSLCPGPSFINSGSKAAILSPVT